MHRMIDFRQEGVRLESEGEWDNYFAEGWEQNGGCNQSRLFAEAFCKNTRLSLGPGSTFLDSSVALGDSIPVLKKHFPKTRFFGYDFSEVAIKTASKRFPGYATFSHRAIEDITDHFDVIYSSNTLEHFVEYRERAKMMLSKCRILCILVPYNEQRNGQDLTYSPEVDHVATFREDTFDFLIDEGLAKYIYVSKPFVVPAAWSWSTQQLVAESFKNILRLLLNKPIARNRKSILYEIEEA
jgi:Methyltransferase domain